MGDSLLTTVDLVDLTKHAKLEGDAMEGRRTNGTTSRTDSGIRRRGEHCLTGRNVWSGFPSPDPPGGGGRYRSPVWFRLVRVRERNIAKAQACPDTSFP